VSVVVTLFRVESLKFAVLLSKRTIPMSTVPAAGLALANVSVFDSPAKKNCEDPVVSLPRRKL
jgi:hypothetical protein